MKNLKNKILDNLPTIFVALVFIFGMTLTFNHAYSIPNTEPESGPGIPDTQLERKYDLTKPQGVRGRNSNNTLIREVTGWEPCIGLNEGLQKTYEWIYQQIREGKQDVSLNYSQEAGV